MVVPAQPRTNPPRARALPLEDPTPDHHPMEPLSGAPHGAPPWTTPRDPFQATPSVVMASGKSALDIARVNKKSAIVDLLADAK